MEEILHLCTTNPFRNPLSKSHYPSSSQSLQTRTRLLHLPTNRLSSQISLPKKPPQNPKITFIPPPPPHDSGSPYPNLSEKILYVDSLGLDPFSLIEAHPPIFSRQISDLRSTVNFLRSLPLSPADLRRILSMCPDVLATPAPSLHAVSTFLLREAGLDPSLLRRALCRRPRLLASSVPARLRPTLYFLRSLGIADVCPHSSLLSCSVESKLLPRLHYLQRIGFSYKDSVSMLRRFPALFCYSLEGNFQPKFEYLVFGMGRGLKELKEFPQYFSFSLEKRIKPRHQACVEKGVSLPLALMLKARDSNFLRRLEVCVSSSPPLRSSPLYSAAYLDDDDDGGDDARVESN
ncbi:hypothetical protein AAC387_Pa05g0903 [Persea americana]